ncbi:glycoside hydrolase family 127 protein [Amphibacillus sediminis]|uniref:glycoside hydrolase family 127 protein n=1 Tax=Amphibacillus sediminis TaxID=360185 RepID=UPI000834637D|nr:beta-L-arabinofuranosidase domain-containing protein [Amphibacillus sediminis]
MLPSNTKRASVKIEDDFWVEYRRLIKAEMIPYQWKVLNDQIDINIERERNDHRIPTEKSHAIENFKIAAGHDSGKHYGMVFQDSDVYKWLEAVAYSLRHFPDPDLEQLADSVVDLIAEAQEEDGYLNTYFTINEPYRKYKRLAESHELYCAGHYIEAAVAYYETTGKDKCLKIAQKLANHLFDTFGVDQDKLQGFDGHEEIELALVKLYQVTKDQRYLELSQYFLYERGTDPTFFAKQKKNDPGSKPVIEGMEHFDLEYYQAHKPVIEQEDAVGHAVRLVYLSTAMAEVSRLTYDKRLQDACKKLWKSIVRKRMYITGGIGSTVNGEAFTTDYDLPNDTMYCETCASIGLIFFAHSMLKNEPNAEYANVLERALYNTVLAGMALDGKHFFYVNPLEVEPKKSKGDPQKSHIKVTRPGWFGCACCPPNIARLLTSLEKYIYHVDNNKVWIHLFVKSEIEVKDNTDTLKIKQSLGLLESEKLKFEVHGDNKKSYTIAIRIPDWVHHASFKVNDKEIIPELKEGYAYFTKNWGEDELITMSISAEPRFVYANPLIRDNLGKVALQKGPFIYCLEGKDNSEPLQLLSVKTDSQPVEIIEEDDHLIKHKIICQGLKISDRQLSHLPLYDYTDKRYYQETELTFIPYYCWANRGPNEMQVWVDEA